MYQRVREPPQQGRRSVPQNNEHWFADPDNELIRRQNEHRLMKRNVTGAEQAIHGGGFYQKDVSGNVPNGEGDVLQGLPRRHPGPQRLQRGMGVDGQGHDHQGRQIATSMVDEVIFSRAPATGKMHHLSPGANFGIDGEGNFAKR